MTCWATSGSGPAQRTNGLTVEVRPGALIKRKPILSVVVPGITNRDGRARRIVDLADQFIACSSMAFVLPEANSTLSNQSQHY